jgi:hypothetical protein
MSEPPAPNSYPQTNDTETLDTVSGQTGQISKTYVPADCRTFELTLSPDGDISEQCQESVKNYIVKNCLYSHIVLENGASGKLHMHALLAFRDHHEYEDLKKYIKRHLVAPHHPNAYMKHAVTLVTQYDHDWYDRYLRKEEKALVLHDNYDRNAVGLLFPSQQTQRYLQSKSESRSPCATMLDHESRWIKMFPSDSSLRSAADYYYRRANELRDLAIPTDPQKQRNFISALWRFRNKTGIIQSDIAWIDKLDPPPKPVKKAKIAKPSRFNYMNDDEYLSFQRSMGK